MTVNNRTFFLSTTLLLLFLGTSVVAQTPNKNGLQRKRQFGQRQLTPAQRTAIMRRFDRNGDGRLDEKERQAAIAAFRNRSGNLPQGGPKTGPAGNKPGAAMMDRIPAFVKQRFDANKNGKLDPAELQRLREFYQNRRKGNAGNARTGKPAPTAKPNGRPGTPRKPGAVAGQGQRKIPEFLVQRFDANKNGRLDPEELQKLRAMMQSRGGITRKSPTRCEAASSSA